MNTIPNISGPVRRADGAFRASPPLAFQGACPSAGLFPLAPSDDPVLRLEDDPALPPEGYRLTVEPAGLTLSAAGAAGQFYGLQTIFQQLGAAGEIPCGVYEDAPRYPYRSFMLDVSRHFFPLDEVKKLVDQCAKLKLNTFHWHLSDDQGFRVESKKFPRLNTVSSWRLEGDKTVGGYYTQAEIRELVAYAGERFVQVIPEIDLPGHTSAITAAYPELCCSGEPGEVEAGPGIFPRILCGGEEKVYAFLEDLLDEVCPLFPAPYFHIGGDEAPKSEWEKCPKCQAAMGRYGLKTEEELQAHFTGRLEKLLQTHGKTLIGWNEILASGAVSPSAVAQYWTDQGAAYSAAEIPKGREFVFSNVSSFYFDYDPALVTLKGAYLYEPMIPGGEAVPPEQALGLEAPLWTEWVETPQRLEELVFPRLAALAENAWSREKDWEDFLTRLPALARRWQAEGVNAGDWEAAARVPASAAARALIAQLRRWFPDGDVRLEEAAGFTPEKFAEMVISPSYTSEERAAIVQALRQELGI